MKFGSLQVRLGLLALALGSLVWGFWLLLSVHAPDSFANPKEDMSYGWYVPIFALYVVWTERKQLVESLGEASWGGLLATLPFLLVGFLGVRGIQMRFEVVAFAGLLLTIPWAFFGRETAKRLLFPAVFLLFCMPLASFLDIVTVHLRLLATSAAYWVMKGFGADVVRQGTALGAANGSFAIDVAEPCSGLRSIFALMALTAGYAYFTQKTWIRRGVLFAMSVPLAVLGNVMRILTICLVANYASSDFATGFYHDYSGYVVFIVAIALMVACGEALNRFLPSVRSPKPDAAAKGGGLSGGWNVRTLVLSSVTTVVVVWMMALLATTPATTLCEAPDVRLGEIAGYESQEFGPTEAERTMLPEDTQITKRVYTAQNGEWYQVSVVIGGSSKGSIHRPELCLPSQGFLMTNPRTLQAAGTEWRALTLAGGSGHDSIGFAYTFFNQEGYRTSSHVKRIFRDVCDRSFLNRIDRWVMVTVNASRWDDPGLTVFLSKLKEVVR